MRPFRVVRKVGAGNIAFEASGKDLSTLFTNAGKGLEGLVVPLSTVKKVMIRKVNTQGENTGELLYKFLSDLIFLKDTYQLVFSGFEIKVADDGRSLSGLLKGETVERKRHKINTDIKALTKHRFKLTKEKEAWVLEAVVDVGK